MKAKVSCDQVLDLTVAADFSDTEALSTCTPRCRFSPFYKPRKVVTARRAAEAFFEAELFFSKIISQS